MRYGWLWLLLILAANGQAQVLYENECSPTAAGHRAERLVLAESDRHPLSPATRVEVGQGGNPMVYAGRQSIVFNG